MIYLQRLDSSRIIMNQQKPYFERAWLPKVHFGLLDSENSIVFNIFSMKVMLASLLYCPHELCFF